MPSRADVLARSAALTETAEQRAARQVAAAYNQARRELLAALLEGWTGSSVMTPDDAARLLRQSGLLQQIDARLLQLEREVGITLRGIVTDSSERALDGMRRELALLPPDLRPRDLDMFGTINSRMVEQYVPLAMSDWHGLTVGMSTNLQRELQVGLIQGEAFPDLSRRLLAQAPGDGPGAVFPRAQTSADLATRRLVIAAENGAKQAAIAEVAQSIPLIQKQAIAAIGKNTTDCCLRVHGQIVDNDKPFELVGEPRFADELMTSPFHWNCRTSIAMYHPFFEESMPTAKLKADAARELKKREEEKSGKGKKRDEGAARRAVTVARPEPPTEPAFDYNDPVQVRARIAEIGRETARRDEEIEEKLITTAQEMKAIEKRVNALAADYEKQKETEQGRAIRTALNKAQDEYVRTSDDRARLIAEQSQMRYEEQRKYRELVSVRDPARVPLKAVGVDAAILQDWQRGMDEFNRLVSETVATKPMAFFNKIPDGERAFFNPASVSVNVPGYASTKTVVHELGHWLEDTNPDIHRQALAFYDRRTQGYNLEWMGPGYERNELTRRDKFIEEYMGKDYGRQATEIVSMGLEWMYTKPAMLASRDADMFDFIFNLVRGR